MNLYSLNAVVVQKFLSVCPDVEYIYLYGSRATQFSNEYSDVDYLFISEKIPDIGCLQDFVSDLCLPFKVDFVPVVDGFPKRVTGIDLSYLLYSKHFYVRYAIDLYRFEDYLRQLPLRYSPACHLVMLTVLHYFSKLTLNFCRSVGYYGLDFQKFFFSHFGLDLSLYNRFHNYVLKLPDYDFINFCYREFLDLYSGFLSLFFSVLDCHKSHIFELYSVSDVSAFCSSINNPLLATRQFLNLHSTEFSNSKI